jgi:23S rRNA (pseudouridine1915-N3)-methyltransferase
LKITIIAVGKLKEKYLCEAVSEYSKRLSKYCKLSVIEVEDEKIPELALEKEAAKILRHLPDDAHIISLEIAGQAMDSEKFAVYLSKQAVSGSSHFAFIIGGSLGLHQSVMERADLRLSFSKMTFPHQLMRVILLEQIYRAFRINNNEPYHK